jgi:hypothetical protein
MAADDDGSNLAFDDTSQPMDVDEPSPVINDPENQCYCQSDRCQGFNLAQQLDTILDPGFIFSAPNQPDKLWTILARGYPDPDAYISELNEYRIESHCGLAWPPGYIAYRCRTCSAAITMSICAECFRAGNHEGHDYNMFKSRNGGACDCGYSIMKLSGHCSNHGQNARAPKSHEPIPDRLTCLARRAMPRMMSRLVIQLRRQAVGQTMETDIYLDCLMKIANSSAILRNLMIQVILSGDAYSSQAKLLSHHRDSRVSKIVKESQKILKRERKKLVTFKIPSSWPATKRNINAFCDKPPHKTFLEELIFWMVVHEFHQKLVCFLLGFLMDNTYKEIFYRSFVNYYPNIAFSLTSSQSHPRRHLEESVEHLSRRILQVSVQIFIDGELTRKICEEEMTLHTLIYCLRIMIEGSQSDGLFSALKTNPLCQHSSNAPKVVCCDNSILRDRQLSSFTEDLLAILSFEHEAKRLLSDKNLLQVWLEMLSWFQTMNPCKRELNEHAPYETGPRQSVFIIESEFCLVPLWTILGHMNDPQTVNYTSQLLESIHATLASWFYRMSIGLHSKLDTYFMSFHIPLHRMFAATLRHMIYKQKIPEEQVFSLLCKNQAILGSKFSYRSAHGAKVTIKIDDFIRILLLHPLQALTLYHQTRSGMWTRNGVFTVNQAMTYAQCAYCYSIIDMDMFMLRYCAFKLRADTFLKLFLQKFYAWHCLSFTCGPIFSDTPSDTLKVHYYFNIQPEQITQMVESCLVTLIQLLTLGNHCNVSDREQTKQEMIGLISVADRSYSFLVDMLPNIFEHHKDDGNFSSLLDEITVYKPASHGAGGNLHQGCYTLKPNVWENDYNPIHILYRYYQRRDYQQSLDRFFQQAKSAGKLNRRSHSSALWPPLRIPEKIANFGPIDLGPLVQCQTLLGVIFSILYKCIYVEDMPDSMMAYTIHLLELSLRKELELLNEQDHPMNDEQDQASAKAQRERFVRNPSFVGRYSYRELISYYESMPKEEAILKGRTIYSLFTEEPVGPEPQMNVRLFPFIKHALDLAFDTTWFPFTSTIDNCLVHMETVHSLPRDEFDAMIQCSNNDKNDNESTYEESLYAAVSSDRTSEQNFPDMSTTSSTRSIESQTGTWSNLIGLEVEEVDDIEIELDNDDEFEVENSLNAEDLDEDETGNVGGSSELSLSNQLGANETSIFASSPSVASASTSLATTTVPSTPALNVDSDGTFVLVTQRDIRASVTQTSADSYADASDRLDASIQDYIRMRTEMARAAELEPQNLANQQNSTSGDTTSSITHHDGATQMHLPLLSAQGETANNSIQQLPSPMLPLSFSGESASFELQRQEQEQQPPAQAQNLVTEQRALLDSQPRAMITNSPQPLALEAASSSSTSTTTAGITDASTSVASDQDLQRAHQSHYSSYALGAVNQNLTSSGAVVPRTLAQLSPNLPKPGQASNQIESSLSEIDIQARFMGFFQSVASSSFPRIHPNRAIRPRQTARRGNYRGAHIEPYLPYNNLNNNNSTAATNNNDTNNNNNNNNNNETVQELVRRSVAMVPAITDAVRSTIQQTAQRMENLATGIRSSIAVDQVASGQDRAEAAANDSSPPSSPSPPPSGVAGERIVTPRRQVAIRSSSGSSGGRSGPPGPAAFHMVNRFIATRSNQQQTQQDQRSRRLRKEHRQHHGESILTLLLRLHAKYSQQPRSYYYDERRAQTSLDPRERCRIGDGAHFVTIALDLICASDSQIRQRVEYLVELIWPKPACEKLNEKGLGTSGLEGNEKGLRGEMSAANRDDIELGAKTSRANKSACAASPTVSSDMRATSFCATTTSAQGLNLSGTIKSSVSPTNPVTLLTPEEKRHRAKERQSRLMAEFANKQRAFMEQYMASTSMASSTTSNLGRTGSSSNSDANPASFGGATMGEASQRYSISTSQAGDRAHDAANLDRYEEQPINLSSKSNQEQGSRSESVSVDNNGRHSSNPAAGVCDSSHNDQTQLASAANTSDDKDITNATASSGPVENENGRKQEQRQEEEQEERHQQRQQQQQQKQQQQPLSWSEMNDRQTSSASSPSVGSAASGNPNETGPKYECCICGIESLSNSTNPLGQVVLLQSTSVYGHSHLRRQSERKLPCDESEHLNLKEETYAKYLERRIDILCEHFTESSWLDSINIGAEGGVHVQSCGHHLHIECHQSYIRSLDHEDGLRARNDSDEFQCPVCRQLANSVLPILDNDFFFDADRAKTARPFHPVSNSSLGTPMTATTAEQSHDDPHRRRHESYASMDCDNPLGKQSFSFQASDSTALALSESFDDQIAQIGLQLRNRRAPNQRELQSSATFCSHLTKATGPQYRLIRTNASMHSLFLFLNSIARTNLETGLIARSIKLQNSREPTVSGVRNNPAGSSKSHEHQPTGPIFQTVRRADEKRTCYQLLFQVLALNAQTLINDQWCTYDHVWSGLTHSVPEANRLSIRPRGSEVPLLLRDPVAMLLQFLFTISGSKSHGRSQFNCLVKVLFNLTVIQSTALVLSYVRSVPQLRAESPKQSPSSGSQLAKSHSQPDKSQDPALKKNKQQDDSLSHSSDDNRHQLMGLEGLLWSVWTNLGPLLARTKEEPLMNSVVRSSWPRLAGQLEEDIWCDDERAQQQKKQEGQALDERTIRDKKLEFIENKIKLACLPFLRAATFLQEHLYGYQCPNLLCELDEGSFNDPPSVDADFNRLVRCLELGSTNMLFVTGKQRTEWRAGAATGTGASQTADITYDTEALSPIRLHSTLNWPSSAGLSGQNLVDSWAAELLEFARERSIAARTLLLSRPLVWYRPSLMQLPHSFDDIFMFYYRRKCSLCQQVPKDVAVCLVCGAPICFRASCCKDRSRSRQVHSQHCGANTAVFLAVHTSAVVVIRGNRACVWGSVYLDAHDEEDNGLQRGKPLYMVPARFALLQTQWLTHSFDHTCGKRWIYLQEAQ